MKNDHGDVKASDEEMKQIWKVVECRGWKGSSHFDCWYGR